MTYLRLHVEVVTTPCSFASGEKKSKLVFFEKSGNLNFTAFVHSTTFEQDVVTVLRRVYFLVFFRTVFVRSDFTFVE